MTKIENWLETSGYDKLWTMMRNNGQPYLNSILIVPKSNAPPVTNFDNSPKLEEKKSIYGPRKQARYPKLEKFAAESLREGAAEPLDPSKL